MKRIISFLLMLIVFTSPNSLSAQESQEKRTFHIRTDFQANDEGRALKKAVRSSVNSRLQELGHAVTEEREADYEYTIKVTIFRQRGTIWNRLPWNRLPYEVAVQALVTEGDPVWNPELHSVIKTGKVSDISEICAQVVGSSTEAIEEAHDKRREETLMLVKFSRPEGVEDVTVLNMWLKGSEDGASFAVDEDTIRKYADQLYEGGAISSNLSDEEVEIISQNPAKADEILQFTNKPIKDEKLRSLAREMRAVGTMDRELTAADAAFIRNNAKIAPRLVEITKRAHIEAAKAYERNPDVPKAAYRRVLWSYLMTKEFGSGVAEKAGEAHEIKIEGLIDEEGATDLRNNAIGRRYAVEGLSEDQILESVMKDERIMSSDANE